MPRRAADERPLRLALERRQFESEKAAALERKIEVAAQVAAREAAKQAEQVATELPNQALARMTPHGRQIEDLRHRCQDLSSRISGGNFRKHPPDIGRAGLYQDANRLIKSALEGTDWSAVDKQTLADMLELWLPKVVAPWDAKEQRKKLKFSDLRAL